MKSEHEKHNFINKSPNMAEILVQSILNLSHSYSMIVVNYAILLLFINLMVIMNFSNTVFSNLAIR